MLSAFLPGFLLGLSLIVAIGAQNAFVLRQGLRGEHILAICLTCAVSDAVLILVGVSSFAQAAYWVSWLETATRYAGAGFLFAYGLRSFWAAVRSGDALMPANTVPADLGPTLATCLALTWLNPHVYLDTVVLVGSLSTQFAARRRLRVRGDDAILYVLLFIGLRGASVAARLRTARCMAGAGGGHWHCHVHNCRDASGTRLTPVSLC
jgi:L-lysine exporter family protein LysE/ArgO